MYVIYHSSDSFVSVTAVSMLSLFENNKSFDNIHILYIGRGISDTNKEKLHKIANQYNRELEFMEMPNWSEKMGIDLKSCKKGWLGFGYNRLFLTEYIPEDIDRVLYLDSDTVIEGDLQEMWETDFEDCYMAGVDDCLSSTYRNIVEISDNGTYCNAGVLLINLKKWREDNIVKRFVDEITDKNGYFIFNEQSILNSVFSGKIKILPQNYNVNSLVYTFKYNELMRLRKPYNFSYTADELENAKNNPVITHFTGLYYVARRPWIENSDHPHREAFDFYRKMTPWADAPYIACSNSKLLKICVKLCHILPRPVMIAAVSVLYNYIRPVLFRIRLKKNRK